MSDFAFIVVNLVGTPAPSALIIPSISSLATYWNYKNDYIDSITKKIYVSDFKSAEERSSLIKQATKEGVSESVRIFLASKTDQYVANDDIDGIINALGAGVPTRFTTMNAKSDNDSLVIGVKQIYQGACCLLYTSPSPRDRG